MFGVTLHLDSSRDNNISYVSNTQTHKLSRVWGLSHRCSFASCRLLGSQKQSKGILGNIEVNRMLTFLHRVCVCVCVCLLSAGFNIWHRNSLGHLMFTHFPSLAQRRNSFQSSMFCSHFRFPHQLIVWTWEPTVAQCWSEKTLLSLNVGDCDSFLLCTIVGTCWFFFFVCFLFDFKIKSQPKFGSLFFFWADEVKKMTETIFWMRQVSG